MTGQHELPGGERDRTELLAGAERMLAEIATADDAIALIMLAEAARLHARQATLGTSAINHATVIKMRAERRLADAVDAGQAAGQIATPRDGGRPPKKPAQCAGITGPPTLADLGIKNSSRLAEARIIRDTYTDADIAELKRVADDADRELSRRHLVDAARDAANRTRRDGAIAGRYDTYDLTPPDDRPVPVIYADPPWRYDFTPSDSRKLENHYPTLATADIEAIDPHAERDAVLWLWATSPKLPEALGVMAAWGFTYRTSMVWVKPQIGMGRYARNQHEFLLIGAAGQLPVPAPEHRPPSVIDARRTGHSVKPPIRPLLDVLYPGLRKREMFAREPAAGLWLTHGYERQAGQ